MSSARKIIINGRFLYQKRTGVQKYALGISVALQNLDDNVVVVAPYGQFDAHGLKVRQWGIGKGHFWEQVCLPLFMLLHKNAVVINLCNTAPLLLLNHLVCIHDLAFLKNKKWFGRAFRFWYGFLVPRICKRAQAVICVTDHIKREIVDAFRLPPKKITVVPNGIPDMPFINEKPFSFDYVLMTGIFNKRKNTSFVMEMMPELIKRGYHIVGVGADASIYGQTKWAQEEHLHVLEYVDDTRYYTLLKHAAALIYPSTYEGFGVPVLEALVMGIPVIVPDMEMYKESFDKMPIYFKPGDRNDFLLKLDTIKIKDASVNDAMVLKNKFNFTASARIIVQLLEKI